MRVTTNDDAAKNESEHLYEQTIIYHKSIFVYIYNPFIFGPLC